MKHSQADRFVQMEILGRHLYKRIDAKKTQDGDWEKNSAKTNTSLERNLSID